MSEFTDLLLQVFGAKQALLFLGLLAADCLQTWYLNGRFGRVERRVERIEGVHITDGGTDE